MGRCSANGAAHNAARGAPVTALERVVILDRAQDILNRDVMAVDMRLSYRPTVRLGEAAREDIREINEIEFGGQR